MKKHHAAFVLSGLLTLIGACRNNGNPPRLQGGAISSAIPSESEAESIPVVESNDNVLVPAAPEPEPVPSASPQPSPAPTPAAPFYPDSCAAIKKARPESLSGPYKIYLDANLETRKAIDASCDMQTDGGGWTLMLSYNHRGGTTPPIAIKTQNLPLLGSEILGDDESLNPVFWGHAGNALFNKFSSAKELRFYCRSSQNTRVVHFKTTDAACVTAAKTGQGNCLGIRTSFLPLTGHTATIPGDIDRSDANQLDSVLTFNTFGKLVDAVPDIMWSIAADVGLNVWECDYGSDSAAFNTIHRVWFR